MPARVLAWVVSAVITALYASVVVRGVVDLIELPRAARENMGLGVTSNGVFWLWFGVLFPVPIYAASVWAARRRAIPIRLLALLCGLGVVAVVQLEVSYLVSRLDFFA
ncbi:hypothetical protein K8P10_000155 [Leucobacter sp. Psy1]|uniref:hypothetical protein n=1 Tax=Leucobacter sp. Psy1 TaxID=2875729 RepID=UPI001CD389D5|nr:hypothetical protein [Leucobacter sp. Psy1]UBH04644.1 hypothetical protein K8P10_000155 [Leucobacter sp. Psy1]